MVPKFWLVVLIGLSAVCAGAQELSIRGEGSPEASERNENAVLDHLLPVVYSSGKAVRLYYRSDCRSATDSLRSAVPFPFVRVQLPSKGQTGVRAVRAIFEKDRNVTVREDETGIIRIWVGKVPTAVLATKVSQLNLHGREQYNPDDVFNALLGTEQMRAAMSSLRFTSVYNPSSGRVDAEKGYPHLPATIRNMKAEQILDEVAKAWAGQVVVTYGACAEPTESDGVRRFWLGVSGQITPKGFR